MAELCPLVKRAQLTRRTTSGQAVNIRSGQILTYAMACPPSCPRKWVEPSIRTIIETPRAATRVAFGARQCAGLDILPRGQRT